MGDELRRLAQLPPTSYTYEVRPVAAPAAGSDFIVPVPSGEVWRLHAVTATLVTSAAVANRVPQIVVDDQSSTAVKYPAGAVQAAGATRTYSWIAGYPILMAAVESALLTVPIVEHLLQPGWRIRPVTVALDVADQWGGITVTLERMNTPPQTIAQHFVGAVEHLRRVADTLEEDGYA